MQHWYLSDMGCVRSTNQDMCAMEQLDKNTLLCVVCDGMGGAKSGNVASTLACDMFTQEMKDAWNGDLDSEKFQSSLHNAVKTANFTVYDQAQQFPEFSGMGTTLVAAIVQPKKCVVVNVGDSRAYRINPDGITQITQDHSLVQMMVDRGEITPEQAKVNPSKNLITRAVGTEPSVICDIFPLKLEKGDYLLLCSDGLTNLLDDQEILFEVVHGGQADDCCVRLLEIAKKRGAPDNVTCILVSV